MRKIGSKVEERRQRHSDPNWDTHEVGVSGTLPKSSYRSERQGQS